MLAQEMLVVEVLGNRMSFRVGGQGLEGHGGDLFDDAGDVGGFGRGSAPTKRGVPGDQHRWRTKWIEFGEAADDGVAGIGFVLGANLPGSEGARHRNRAVEVVGMGSAKTRDFAPGLRPRGSGA